jgi:hypothetical protein
MLPPAFLGCRVLISPTLVFRFQQDYHLILLDATMHVKTNTYPFQITIWDTYVMLLEVV